MPVANPTTWRWPDSTFGPQVKVPFNDNQQYPDCGPSIRVYTLENILYGLEDIITPLLQQIANNSPNSNEISASLGLSNTETQLGTATCKTVTIYMLNSASAPAEITIDSANGGTPIILEAGYSMQINVNSLTKVTAVQTGDEGDVLYFKYQN
jgi:hypothetical protein